MKRGTPRHPKTKALARELKIKLYAAVGLLEMLWHFTGEFAPRGDIGRVSNEDIADGVAWDKDAGILITCLVKTHWLDASEAHRLIVHDWTDHADDAVVKKLRRTREDFLPEYPRRRDTVASQSRERPSVESDGVGHTRAEGLGKARQGSGKATVLQADTFEKFTATCVEKGIAFTDDEMPWMQDLWNKLSIQEQIAAVRGIIDRVESGEYDDPRYRHLAKNYLEKKIWTRAVRQRNGVQAIPAKPSIYRDATDD